MLVVIDEHGLVLCRRRLQEFIHKHGWRDKMGHVFWGGLKDFSDGSLGASTALFHQPYEGTRDTFGVAVHDFGWLGQQVRDGHDLSMQVSFSFTKQPGI